MDSPIFHAIDDMKCYTVLLDLEYEPSFIVLLLKGFKMNCICCKLIQ